MSFSDLLSSGRGPGVIGTLVALLVLVGFGTLYIFVFDEGLQGGGKTIESIVREQDLAIKSNKEEILRLKKQLSEGDEFKAQAEEEASLKTQSERNAALVEEATSGKANAQGSVAAALQKWEDYKDDYRASEWTRAKGEKLGTITSLAGVTYTDVVIREVNHKEMKITDSTGPKNIASDDLPKDLQTRFQFDDKKKEALVKAENETEEVHRKRVQLAETQAKRDDKVIQIGRTKGDLQEKNAAIKKANDDIPRWNVKIQQQRSAIAAEKTKKVSKAPILEEELKRMQRAADDNRSSISKLQNDKREIESKINTLEKEVSDLNVEVPKIAKELQDLLAAAGGGAKPQE